MSQRTKSILIALVALLVALVLDQWTKAWAWEHLKPAAPGQPDNPVTVIDGLFYLKFGFNTGSAFSLLRDKSWARMFFIAVTFAALAYMAWLAWTLPPRRRWVFVAVGFIAGGALGNLYDRFMRVWKVPFQGKYQDRHGVVDFLQFYYPWDPDNYWPIFNIADSALVVGMALLLVYVQFYAPQDEALEAGDSADGTDASVPPATDASSDA